MAISKRTITTSEVRGESVTYHDEETSAWRKGPATFALKATIAPPVGLTQEAVSRYVGNGSWVGEQEVGEPFYDPLLIGDSEETTTICAFVEATPEIDLQSTGRLVLATRISKLLAIMDIPSEIK